MKTILRTNALTNMQNWSSDRFRSRSWNYRSSMDNIGWWSLQDSGCSTFRSYWWDKQELLVGQTQRWWACLVLEQNNMKMITRINCFSNVRCWSGNRLNCRSYSSVNNSGWAIVSGHMYSLRSLTVARSKWTSCKRSGCWSQNIWRWSWEKIL